MSKAIVNHALFFSIHGWEFNHQSIPVVDDIALLTLKHSYFVVQTSTLLGMMIPTKVGFKLTIMDA